MMWVLHDKTRRRYILLAILDKQARLATATDNVKGQARERFRSLFGTYLGLIWDLFGTYLGFSWELFRTLIQSRRLCTARIGLTMSARSLI